MQKMIWRTRLIAISVFILGTAEDCPAEEDGEPEFSEAEVFFELNNTDRDLGIHALVDGDAWQDLTLEDPAEHEILEAKLKGSLADQGLTELRFESDEPTFDELSPEEFFMRFPAGTYVVKGTSVDGEDLMAETELTHVIPAAPIFTVNDMDAVPEDPEAKEECEELDELPVISNPVVVAFDGVTEPHPMLGDTEAELEVVRYQVVAEFEDADENAFVTSVDLIPDGADGYSVTLPEEFFVPGTEVKFEVLVREASFNQTASESCPFAFE